MLVELRIENFAIIQSLALDLKPGLTTFTGETGAGKSIILDAIVALLGGRADNALIRAAAERAIVEAVFTIPQANREAIRTLLEGEDLWDGEPTVSIARELRMNGRSVARINGRSVSLSLLRELGEYLVDIHGQSEHLSLLNVRHHLHLLDRFAGAPPDLEAYRAVYRDLRRVQKDLAALRQSEQDAARRIDLLEYQAQEIENAFLKPGEEDDLHQERTRLANAESLATLAQQALTLLDEGAPETPSLSDLFGQLVHALDALARIDESQKLAAEQVQALNDTLVEVGRDLQIYQENIEFNPRRLEQVEERLDLIHRLQRKYGGSIQAVLDFGQSARQELDTIAHATERIDELEERQEDLLLELAGLAQKLSVLRSQAASRLAQAVEVELNDLKMPGAQFQVDLQQKPDPLGLPQPDGARLAFDENRM
jgi:DNA repair protein RecN (Recombination protein N)